MANNVESLVWELLVKDQQASDGLSRVGRAAAGAAKDTDALTAKLNELARKSVEARVRLAGDREALASLDKMDARLISLDRRVASANLRVEGAARAIAEISAVDLEMEKLGGKGGSAEQATASLGAAGLSGPSGIGALIVAGAALSPIIATVGLGLGGLGLAALATTKHTSEMNAVLAPLKTELRDFQNSLQPQVVTLFSDGVGIATGALKQLQPVAAATGNALHGVLGQVGAELQSGEWKQFFTWMAQQAGPDLQLVGNLLVDLAKDIPPLLEQLQPLGRVVLILADAALKAVGGLEKLHLVLPIVGAAAGLLLGGGPIGALIGAFAGLEIQEFAAARATQAVAEEFKAVAQVKFPSSSAVSVDWAAVAGSLGKAAVSTTDVANAMIDLHPKVGTIRGDMDLLNAALVSGNTQLAAYSDLWDKFVGKSVSYQQAVLNLKQAFEGYDSAVKSSGRTSTAAQQSFLSIFTTMESGLQTLQKQGASVGQVNSFYADSIKKLNALHGLTPAQRADIAGLTKDYDAWAASTQGLTAKVKAAAGEIGNDFIATLKDLHHWSPQVSTDVSDFAASILKTGDRSQATKHARDVLIADLEKAGLSAKGATALVDSLQGSIDKMHGKSVTAGVVATGSGGIKLTGPGTSGKVWDLTHNAAGGMITGGVPGKDSVLGLLMPGEVVVPTAMVKAGAVDHLRGRLPGFASGGLVDAPPWAATNLAGLAGPALGADVAATLAALIKAARAAAGYLGAGFGSYAADIQAVLSAMGLPLSLTANWLRQIQTESGGNPRAVNLWDSNAQAGHPSVGLLQLIPATFAAYSGPYRNTPPLVNYGGGPVSEDIMAQIYTGIHYAWARYGASMASVIGQGHGYDQGGYLPTGWSLAYNGTGRPEPVGPAAGVTYNVSITVNVPPTVNPKEAGRQVADLLGAHLKGGGRLYPAGMTPR